MEKQLTLGLPFRGGKRPGAGRPRTRPHPGLEGPGVPHLKREELNGRDPIHITLRLRPGLDWLRGERQVQCIEDALRAARGKFGLRVVHYSIEGAHLHLIVEAESRQALSAGLQALNIRLARGLNRLVKRKGPVFADRYHEHVLHTLAEVLNAVRYVRENFRHHVRGPEQAEGADPCSSAAWEGREDAPMVEPKTWLLRRAGAGAPDE